MDRIILREMLDSCFEAKKITESMAELPNGLKRRHIAVLDTIYECGKEQEVRVSDVSRGLGITTPSVTKLINELAQLGALKKYSHEKDGRVTLLRLTGKGMEYVQHYVIDYHTEWAERMEDITEEEVKNAVRVIKRLYEARPEKGGLSE